MPCARSSDPRPGWAARGGSRVCPRGAARGGSRVCPRGPRAAGPEFARGPGSATVLNAHLPGLTRSAGSAPHADVAQLVEHHLAKVRVAGSNPVVRSEAPDSVPQALARTVLRMSKAMLPPAGNVGAGGVAEWLRQGPAKPCTRVRFPPPPRGRLAQWERASLTPRRSLVRTQHRPRKQTSPQGLGTPHGLCD